MALPAMCWQRRQLSTGQRQGPQLPNSQGHRAMLVRSMQVPAPANTAHRQPTHNQQYVWPTLRPVDLLSAAAVDCCARSAGCAASCAASCSSDCSARCMLLLVSDLLVMCPWPLKDSEAPPAPTELLLPADALRPASAARWSGCRCSAARTVRGTRPLSRCTVEGRSRAAVLPASSLQRATPQGSRVVCKVHAAV
jgi:hypothetical protein